MTTDFPGTTPHLNEEPRTVTNFDKPEALVLMSRDTFEAQFDAARLDRLASLSALGDPVWTNSLDAPEVQGRLADVEVLLTSWGAARVTEEHLLRMPRLRALFHCAGTVRPLITDGFWERGIVVSNVADANAVPVAEFTLAAIIMAGKKAPFLSNDARTYRTDWSYVVGRGELSNLGRTIGIVGFSRIGRRVVSLLQQLQDVTILVADPYADAREVAELGGTLVELEDMLPRLDVLSIHAPALPSTRHMIGARQLALMPDCATLINTARGSLVDTAALEAECVTGRLNAILDVTEPEPLPADSVLYELPNVMLTPHVAGSLGSEVFRMSDSALDELGRYVRGESLTAPIDSDAMRLIA